MNILSKAYNFLLGLPKTILFNLKYLPLHQAIRLPIWVSHRVWLRQLSGRVIIPYVQTGMIKIGFGDIGIFDRIKSRTIWQVGGTVEFMGRARIGHGSKVSVAGELIIGDGFFVSSESSIIAANKVVIGKDVMISWDVLIMDTDFHKIFEGDNRLNADSPINIGDKVWVGCRSLILKGCDIADGVIVAASSTVSRSIDESYTLVAGVPAKIIKHHVSWEE